MRTGKTLVPLLCLLALSPSALAHPPEGAKTGPATPEEARAFVKKVDADLRRLYVRSATAEWIKSTYITDDTERNAALANEEVLGYVAQAIQDSTRFAGLKLDADTARQLYLLRVSQSLVSPSDPQKRAELAALAAKLEGIYGKGKWCGEGGKKECRDLQKLSNVMAKSRDYDELLDAWAGWHTISREMRPLYTRLAELGNEGVREIKFDDLGALWRSGYDMPPAEFEKETDRLWQQVKPLYDQLHCYVRAQLSKQYGAQRVSANGPIPAHLLGNMWAQEWANIYPLVEPYKGVGSLDVDAGLKAQNYDALKMTKLAESFFTSMGLDPLPKTFWERSMFTKPQDREVVCHASAWDVLYNDDLRIKMCIEVKEEDLITLHHELGHDYYFHYYHKLPMLYQQGANDGFHEAIGDAVALSITPGHLAKLNLVPMAKMSPEDAKKNLINVQMKDALEKIAFLPFGKMIDQWRWDVFSGKTKPADYNKAWWELRKKYQGIVPPVARSEADFDPGAKYHIPANVPYTRYFLARILQFQFHRSLCQSAGHKGPLHECSVYGNKEAGKRLKAMLSLGASKPWPEAMQAMTGTRKMDGTAMIDYFAPLSAWLKEQNKGQKCGW